MPRATTKRCQRWMGAAGFGKRLRRMLRHRGTPDSAEPRRCHIDGDCVGGTVCRGGHCVAAGGEGPPQPPSDADADDRPYPRVWERAPGDAGFTKYVGGLLRDARLDPAMRCDRGKEDRLYQRVLSWLVHPHTPIRRLLVAWQLGMGKTIGMLRVLDNFFDVEWPKILLFPNGELVDNFYQEFASTPNRYLRHFHTRFPKDRWPEEGSGNSVGLPARRTAFVGRVRAFMEAWPRNTGSVAGSGLAAPLRAYTFEEAAAATFDDNSVLRWPAKSRPGYVRRSGDACLRHTVLLVDEAHNLLQPESPAGRMAKLRHRIERATNSVAVLFTATPVLRADPADPTADARRLLRLVKGGDYADRGDEGFVSWLMERPPAMFARVSNVHPDGIPKATDVYIDGTVLWDEYAHRRFRRPLPLFQRHERYHPPESTTSKKKAKARGDDGARASEFGVNPPPCIGRPDKDACRAFLANLETTVYADRAEELAAIHAVPLARRDGAEMAPKLDAIARSVTAVRLKTLILIHRETGFHTLVHLLRLHGVDPFVIGGDPVPTRRVEAIARRRVDAEAVGVFNSTSGATGGPNGSEGTLTLVAAAEDFSEGVSFRGVRRIVLADLSPGVGVPAAYLVLQRVGRALRACSHQALPEHLRTLTVDLFVARHRDPALPPTLDAEKYDHIRRESGRLSVATEFLRARAIDGEVFSSALRA